MQESTLYPIRKRYYYTSGLLYRASKTPQLRHLSEESWPIMLLLLKVTQRLGNTARVHLPGVPYRSGLAGDLVRMPTTYGTASMWQICLPEFD